MTGLNCEPLVLEATAPPTEPHNHWISQHSYAIVQISCQILKMILPSGHTVYLLCTGTKWGIIQFDIN